MTYVSHSAQRQKEIAEKLERNMATACIIVEGTAKQESPVDTGRLRASINHNVGTEGNNIIGKVGTTVSYAVFQELGTSRMAAHPFLFPALEMNRGRILETLGGKYEADIWYEITHD